MPGVDVIIKGGHFYVYKNMEEVYPYDHKSKAIPVDHLTVDNFVSQYSLGISTPINEGDSMAETPSKRRRKGREAFEPGVDPNDVCPYPADGTFFRIYRDDWMEGWREAEIKYIEEMEVKQMIARGEGEFEIYFSDLTEECQERLKEYGFYHENIEMGPIAILCLPEE